MRWTELLFGTLYCSSMVIVFGCVTQSQRQLAIVWYYTIVSMSHCPVTAYCLLLWYSPPVSSIYNVAQILYDSLSRVLSILLVFFTIHK